MAIEIILNTVGLFLFLFIFWKKLREDYISIQIFNTATFIIIALIVTNIVSDRLFQVSRFWLNFSGVSLGLTVGIVRYKLRGFETLEAAVIGLFPWLGLTLLSDSIVNSSTPSFVAAVLMFVLVFLYIIFDKHYKRFSWYKSGRVGFSGLTVLGLFFLTRAFVAAVFDNVLSLAMKYEGVLSGIAAFITFLAVFNLARQKT